MLGTLRGQRVIILHHKILNENISKFLVEMLKKSEKMVFNNIPLPPYSA